MYPYSTSLATYSFSHLKTQGGPARRRYEVCLKPRSTPAWISRCTFFGCRSRRLAASLTVQARGIFSGDGTRDTMLLTSPPAESVHSGTWRGKAWHTRGAEVADPESRIRATATGSTGGISPRRLRVPVSGSPPRRTLTPA